MKKLLTLLFLFATCAMNAMDDTKKNPKRCCGFFAAVKKCFVSRRPEPRTIPEPITIYVESVDDLIRTQQNPAYEDDIVELDLPAVLHLMGVKELVPGSFRAAWDASKQRRNNTDNDNN